MAEENWLFRTPPKRPAPVQQSRAPSLGLMEYVDAGLSALATRGLTPLTGAQVVRNVVERDGINRQVSRAAMKVPEAPRDASVDRDMQTAARRPGDLLWFERQVNHGPWDYKFQENSLKYDAFGNFVYGAAGMAMGLPPSVLRRFAGLAQVGGRLVNPPVIKDPKTGARHRGPRFIAKNGVPWGGYPYGDNPEDQPNIDLGIRYAKERGY